MLDRLFRIIIASRGSPKGKIIADSELTIRATCQIDATAKRLPVGISVKGH
jgi:hypothetical protein